ncbi:MAG: hypothetical protein ABSC20_00670 [Candidatus Bathyarchaeia archaeon]|jgi:hypothetical protein
MRIEVKTLDNASWNWTVPFHVEESLNGKRFKGVLATEGISNNKNIYETDLLNSLVGQVVGLKIFFGTCTKVNPNTGQLTANMHDESGEPIGQILRGWIEKGKLWIEGILEESFAKLHKISKGWGLSLKGKGAVSYAVDAAGSVLSRIRKMVLSSIQLLSPNTPRGMDSAEVKEVQESLWVEQPFSDEELASIIVTLNEQGFL